MTTFAPPTTWRGTELLTASPEAFRRTVTAHLRADAPAELWEVLLSPALVDRTVATLLGIRSDALAELQERDSRLTELAQHRADSGPAEGKHRAAEKAHQHWRPRALAFLHHIDARCALVESATGRSLAGPSVVQPADDTSLAAAVATLARAIAVHRDATEAKVDPEPSDMQLWGVLDNATFVHPDGHLQPLAAWAAEWNAKPARAS